MSELDFVRRRRASWDELAALLERARDIRVVGEPGDELTLAAGLRDVAADVARARARGYDATLVARLEKLAAALHAHVHGSGRRLHPRFLWSLPATLRAGWPFVVASAVCFGAPMAVSLIVSFVAPDTAATWFGLSRLRAYEEMYAAPPFRTADENAMMTGYYVWNNVGIAFASIAGGAILGGGTVAILVYNGWMIGATLGWVAQSGHGVNLLGFIAGHSVVEVSALVIAGAAGLRLGHAIVVADDRPTAIRLAHVATPVVEMSFAAALLLLVAALIEGWFSASGLPWSVRVGGGVASAVALAAWMVFGWRR